MHKSREGNAAGRWPDARLLGAGLTCLVSALALGEVTYLDSGKSEIFEDKNNIASTGGKFSRNAEVRVLQVGEKRLSVDEDAFHEPVAVSVYASPDGGSKFVLLSDAELASPGSQMLFALSSDIGISQNMTALDAVATPDLGRMLRPEGGKATRMRVFAPLPEIDDNPLEDDKSPEVLVMSAVPGLSVTITPILGGTPDPEQQESLVLGLPKELSPSLFERGKTAIELVLGDNPAPQQMCIFGLDMSGDLGIKEGQSVVGYQLDIPAGSSFPVKIVLVGVQAPSPLMNAEDGSVVRLGDDLGGITFSAANEQLATPPLQSGTDYASNLIPFQESDQALTNPPVPPPPPPVPAPGAAAIVVGAAALLRRRRAA